MSTTNDAIHSTEQDFSAPQPKAALRRRATDVAHVLQPWLNQMMRVRRGHRVADPHYYRGSDNPQTAELSIPERGVRLDDTFDSLDIDNVRIEELPESRWRVSDKSFPTDDRRGLLGFIERLDDRFEVMELGREKDEFAWFTFLSLAAAAAHFSGTLPSDRERPADV